MYSYSHQVGATIYALSAHEVYQQQRLIFQMVVQNAVKELHETSPEAANGLSFAALAFVDAAEHALQEGRKNG